MQKLLITVLAAVYIMAATAQTAPGLPPSTKVGLNMPNAVETIKTAQDSALFLQLLPPGGTFSWRDRYDKHNEQPEAIVKMYNYLYSQQGRGFSDIFVATDSFTVAQNVAAITTLVNGGVPVPAVEYVNEAFYPAGGYSFNWAKYEANLLPFITAVNAAHPGIVFALPLAPKPLTVFTKEQGGSSAHDSWNNALFAFVAAHPQYKFGVSLHIYYTGAFVPVLGDVTSDATDAKGRIVVPAKRVYNYATDTLDNTYWRNVFMQSEPTQFWEPMLNYIASKGLPGYITECGYIAAGDLNGSWVFAAKAFELVNMYGNDARLASFNYHAGVTKSRVGALAPRQTYDVRNPENPNNVTTPTWDAFSMYFNAQGGLYKYQTAFNVTQPGTYSLWFVNGDNGFTPVITATEGLQFTYTIDAVTATRWGAIATSMASTSKGSVLGPQEVQVVKGLTTVPPLAFGYIVVTVTTAPIYGCMDATATNYNSKATNDDGSCVYPPPPPVVKPCKGFCRWFPNLCKCSK